MKPLNNLKHLGSAYADANQFLAYHFSWDAKEIERMKSAVEGEIYRLGPEFQKIAWAHAFYEPSANPHFVSRGELVSPYLKIEVEGRYGLFEENPDVRERLN